MRRPTVWILPAVILLALAAAAAARPPEFTLRALADAVLMPSHPEAARDTTYLLGGPGRWDGKFETADGDSAWHGWVHDAQVDPPIDTRWNVSDYNVPSGGGQYAMWCGTTYPNTCAEGYGNSWNESLVFTYTVPDPSQSTALDISGVLNVDTEPGFDFCRLQANRGGTWQDLLSIDGERQNWMLGMPVTFTSADYVDGAAQLRLRVTSDSAWSDEDCIWDTQGAVQVDNLTVAIQGGPTFFEDFEDQVSDFWSVPPAPILPGAHLGRNLADDDPDQDNPSWQVNWLGWVPPGDLIPLDSVVASPAIALPPDLEQLVYAFDVGVNQNDEGHQIFYQWHVRSSADADPASLAGAEWVDRDLVYYGTPGYHRVEVQVGDLLVPGARWLQVAFRAIQWVWGWDDIDEAAPYLDNVAVKAVGSSLTSVPAAGVLAVAAFPNPFNPRTTVTLDLPRAGDVVLQVYDLRGRLVRTLHEGPLSVGRHALIWNGDDDAGCAMASGVYYLEAKAVGEQRIGKLTLVR